MKAFASALLLCCLLLLARPLSAQTVTLEKPKTQAGFFHYAFAPDGTGEAVDWFSTETGERIMTHEFKPEQIWYPAFSPDLKRMACTQQSQPIIIELPVVPGDGR